MDNTSEPKVIFEDEVILVLDKPAGWIVNDANTITNQQVVQSWLEKTYSGSKAYSIVNTTALRSGVVHRLDKETSGLLLVAKTKEAFENLQAQFKARRVEKTYTALVHGKVTPSEGSIEATVGRLPWRRNRFGVLSGGREAKTEYRVLSVFSCPPRLSFGEAGRLSDKRRKPITDYRLLITDYSLLELRPKTGRTHQIRIHLKHIGHPIVADEFYAGRKTARKDRKWCPRLFLHAGEIKFNHPVSGKTVQYASVLPDDLTNVLASLRKI